ncbi:polypeptide N-acetylgalactosaminyltransferase 5 [Trichonephila clavipes]|nr:polypeptide N-acetylgalactosaminyltransferase 5 [Trichonephila clavipes]
MMQFSVGGNGGLVAMSPEKKSWFKMKNIVIPHGPGEMGTAFFLPRELENTKNQLYKANGFNALVSDFISLNRTLPDIRHSSCRVKEYLSKLPKVSFVIPFHNEHWSTLLRTVTSVVNRSPSELIYEIILVDDYSTKGNSGQVQQATLGELAIHKQAALIVQKKGLNIASNIWTAIVQLNYSFRKALKGCYDKVSFDALVAFEITHTQF